MYLCRWRTFALSRWLTLGSSCKSLVWGLCIGLEHWVRITIADPNTPSTLLGGFTRLTFRLKKFTVLATVVSCLPEAVIAELLVDDRVARHAEKLRLIMQEEVQWVESLPSAVWSSLADVVGGEIQHGELRHEAVRATHVAAAYGTHKVFKVVDSYPWTLATGDIASNLRKLGASPEPIADS